MLNEFRYPNITGTTPQAQITQIKSYLYQLVDTLQFMTNNIATPSTATSVKSGAAQADSAKAEANFSEIKALIIKSADIVEAYYEEINKRFTGVYVAHSDFGTFTEQTSQDIEENSASIAQVFVNLQEILTDIENLNFTLAEVNAHIRSGLLYYDEDSIPIYGLEIGQKNTIDGKEVFNKFARFTADRLSFYDNNGTEVAYISDYKLYIRSAEITDSFQEGGYKDFIDSNGGVVTKWVGRG